MVCQPHSSDCVYHAGGSWFGSLTVVYAVLDNSEDFNDTSALDIIVSSIEASCWGFDQTHGLVQLGSGSVSVFAGDPKTGIYSNALDALSLTSFDDDGAGFPGLIVTYAPPGAAPLLEPC